MSLTLLLSALLNLFALGGNQIATLDTGYHQGTLDTGYHQGTLDTGYHQGTLATRHHS
ncbi:MAG: hypothetical protein ACLPYS_13955 [Vulcanimicrobiaceae bacterium]